MLSQRLKRETISARAQSRYNAQRNRRYIGFLAESLTRKDIREMHLDDRQGNSGQRVSQRHARVSEAAWIDHDPIGLAALTGHRLLNPVDQLAFVVGLECIDHDAQFLGGGFEHAVDVREGLVTVDLRLTPTE